VFEVSQALSDKGALIARAVPPPPRHPCGGCDEFRALIAARLESGRLGAYRKPLPTFRRRRAAIIFVNHSRTKPIAKLPRYACTSLDVSRAVGYSRFRSVLNNTRPASYRAQIAPEFYGNGYPASTASRSPRYQIHIEACIDLLLFFFFSVFSLPLSLSLSLSFSFFCLLIFVRPRERRDRAARRRAIRSRNEEVLS